MKLLVNSAIYTLWTPKKEADLEDNIQEHAKDIFGEDSIFFNIKQKIKTPSGVGSIPDGYVIKLGGIPCWYVIEVELASHPIFEHIVPQITKFSRGISSLTTQRELVDLFYKDIKSDVSKQNLLKKTIGTREIHEFLSSLISTSPTLIIMIDKKTDELGEVCQILPLESKIIEFKTFEEEGASLVKHAHLFDPLATGQTLELLPELLVKLRQRFIDKKPSVKPNKVYNRGYCSITISGHPKIHTEWLLRQGKWLSIELHLERTRAENSKLLEKLIECRNDLEKGIGEPLTFEFWGKRWARIYVQKELSKSEKELLQWGVDTMLRFYEKCKPILDRIDTKI